MESKCILVYHRIFLYCYDSNFEMMLGHRRRPGSDGAVGHVHSGRR